MGGNANREYDGRWSGQARYNVVKSFDTAKPRRHDDRSHRPRSTTPENASSTTGSLSAPATVGNIVENGVVAKLGAMYVVDAIRNGHANN
jgi:hypothetical protein